MSNIKTNKSPGTVEIGPPKVEGESRVRRLAKAADKLVTQPFEGIDTVYDIVQYAARTHGTRDAFGYRDVIDIVEEEKEVKKFVGGKETTEVKKWKYFHLSDFKYISYLDVQEAVSEIARALIDLGITTEDIVNVYSSTR
jgi:long-chain acyl-CoA synthetase